MKYCLLLVVCIVSGLLGNTQVVINEITPDPGNYDGQGAEWTELYNPTGAPVNIGKWILTDGEEIISIPAGTTIPAGGFFLIYNSNFFACNTCNWDGSITAILTASNSLNIATCGCTNQTAGSGFAVTWDNGTAPTSQDRVVLFKPDGSISDAVYYGSGARYAPATSPILEADYAPGGALTQIGANAYDGAVNFDIPALTNSVWEFIGANNVGCTTSFGRIADGGNTWFTDYFPTPVQTNTLTDYSITVNGSPITGADLGGTLVINTCSATNYLFSVAVPGYNKLYRDYDGDDGDPVDNTTTLPSFPNAEGGSPKGGSTINATGGISLSNQSWTGASVAAGVTTLTYTSPVVGSSTIFTLKVKENTQGPINNPNESGFGGSVIGGNGQGAECYIEQKIQINFISAITAASFTCVNGLVTVSTIPATGTGTLIFELMSGATVLESNATGKFFLPTGSPANAIRVTQSGTGCGGIIIATGALCTATPACPNPNGETINGGTAAVTACPGDVITLAVNGNTSVNLTSAQTIDWFSGSTPSFNPYNNEGVYIGQSTITGAPPTPKTCTNLAPGDIAIIDVQGSSNDRFSFVPLVPIAAGTQIVFTDNGWLSAGGFRSGEGAITYTVGAATLNAGTVVTVTDAAIAGVVVAPSGTVTRAGSFNISTFGDQLIAYCPGSPITPLAAVHTNGSSFDANAIDANTSALPSGLAISSSAIAVGNTANTILNCTGGTVTGSSSQIATIVYSAGSWTNSGSLQTLPSCTYNVNFTSVNNFGYTVPESFCNQTTYLKGVVKPLAIGCSQTDATTITFQVNVVCPTATITGQSAVCSGTATTVPVTLTNTGSCTQAIINYSINGAAQAPQGPLTITGGQVNLTGIATAGVVTINSVTLSGGCTVGTCTVKVSGEHVVTIRTNPSAPAVSTVYACIGDVMPIMATGTDVISWYSDAAGTIAVGSGNPLYYTAAAPAGAVTLYLKSIDPDNGCESLLVPVTVNVFAPPLISVANVNCATGAVQLATGGTNLEYKLLSKNGVGGDAIATTNTSGAFNLIGSSTATFSLTNTVTGCKDLINVDFIGICGVTLPVRFISFNCSKQNGGVLLKWKVGAEETVKKYNIEYSYNGSDFYMAGQVNSLRGVESQYQHFDNRNTATGKIFYRIAAIEDNGKIYYSTLQMVQFDASFGVTIAPNPVLDKLIISIAGSGKHVVKISNSTGQILFNQEISISVFEVNTSQWPAGMYYIDVFDESKNEHKIIKVMK